MSSKRNPQVSLKREDLTSNQEQFIEVYESYCVNRNHPRPLAQTGVHVLRGFLNQEEIETGTALLRDIHARRRKVFFSNPVPKGDHLKVEVEGIVYWAQKPEEGRTRAQWYKPDIAPEFIQRLMNHPTLIHLFTEYYQASVSCSYVLAETLAPALQPQRWHVDRIMDQCKAMILLTDTEFHHGPLRLVAGTHQKPSFMDNLFFRYFLEGASAAYMEDSFVRRHGEKNIGYYTGTAGDCILFDTTAIHSGTLCQKEERLTFDITFEPSTEKNRFMKSVSSGMWM